MNIALISRVNNALISRVNIALVDQTAALRPRMFEKSIRLAPQTELQALFAEDAVEGLFNDPAFLLHERLAQWRRQPLPYRFRIMCRAIQFSALRLDFRIGYLHLGICPVR